MEPVWGGAGREKVWKRLVSVLVKIVGRETGSGHQLNLGVVWDVCVRVKRVMRRVKPRRRLDGDGVAREGARGQGGAKLEGRVVGRAWLVEGNGWILQEAPTWEWGRG